MNTPKIFLAAVLLALAAQPAPAQRNPTDDPPGIEDNLSPNELQGYSQQESLANKATLGLMAVNRPDELEGIPVLGKNGTEIGHIDSIARRSTDGSLHAILRTTSGARTAIRFDALNLDALAFWDPARALDAQAYASADFEPVSQLQSGHTAWGSLSTPTFGTDRTQTAPVPEPGPQTLPADARRQQQADQAAEPAEQPGQAPSSTTNTLDASVYPASGSPIVQMALTSADSFPGKTLISATGATLGRIEHIARNLHTQQLHAIIARVDGTAASAVELEALTVGRLVYDAEEALPTQEFDEAAFERVTRR